MPTHAACNTQPSPQTGSLELRLCTGEPRSPMFPEGILRVFTEVRKGKKRISTHRAGRYQAEWKVKTKVRVDSCTVAVALVTVIRT